MKNNIAFGVLGLLFAFTLLSESASAQCCPYLDAVEIYPTNPTPQDSVYLITEVTTPNQGAYLGYEIFDSTQVIHVHACYFSGMLTALQTYLDTINLGVKPPGTYQVEFVAKMSETPGSCVAIDSQTTSVSFSVGYAGIEELLDNGKELVKIVDIMGRPAKQGDQNKLLIYIYSDGTSEKVMSLTK